MKTEVLWTQDVEFLHLKMTMDPSRNFNMLYMLRTVHSMLELQEEFYFTLVYLGSEAFYFDYIQMSSVDPHPTNQNLVAKYGHKR